jgi:hypothetical protein
MIRQIGVPHQRANCYTTVDALGYLGKVEMIDVNNGRRRLNPVLHQIDNVRTASQKLRSMRGS